MYLFSLIDVPFYLTENEEKYLQNRKFSSFLQKEVQIEEIPHSMYLFCLNNYWHKRKNIDPCYQLPQMATVARWAGKVSLTRKSGTLLFMPRTRTDVLWVARGLVSVEPGRSPDRFPLYLEKNVSYLFEKNGNNFVIIKINTLWYTLTNQS